MVYGTALEKRIACTRERASPKLKTTAESPKSTPLYAESVSCPLAVIYLLQPIKPSQGEKSEEAVTVNPRQNFFNLP